MKRQRKKNRNLFTGEVRVYRESNNELIMTIEGKNLNKPSIHNMLWCEDDGHTRFTPSIDFIPRKRTYH